MAQAHPAPPTTTASQTGPVGHASLLRPAVLPRSLDEAAASAPPPDAPGDRPRYEVLRRLGEGAFGEVDLARDNDIARLVAIKRIKAGDSRGETLSRFVDEIQAVGQLEHPGITPIHDVGLDERGYFFVMKYVEGEPLDRIIARLRLKDADALARFSYEARAALFLQILQTIRFAHERGVLHRDLKPDNIMVGLYGEVVLMDWGLSKRCLAPPSAAPPSAPPSPTSSGAPSPESIAAALAASSPVGSERLTATRTGALVGTPAYMSPEQARGRHDLVDQRSDLYALAAVFYELLTLDHYLTPKKNLQTLLLGVMTEEPLSAVAMHHRYGIPPEFTFFLRKGLEKDPAKRFQSADEMAHALRSILDGNIPVQCPCTGLKAAGNRWFDFIDAHPIGAVTAAVLTAACALYGAFGIVSALARLLR